MYGDSEVNMGQCLFFFIMCCVCVRFVRVCVCGWVWVCVRVCLLSVSGTLIFSLYFKETYDLIMWFETLMILRLIECLGYEHVWEPHIRPYLLYTFSSSCISRRLFPS